MLLEVLAKVNLVDEGVQQRGNVCDLSVWGEAVDAVVDDAAQIKERVNQDGVVGGREVLEGLDNILWANCLILREGVRK